ncbi:MAG TPA: hypothetical protein VGN57_21455 [Pirellulaceae bacterium]|jgi:hypothetical protein|nr:hypothetical protein [Pirellulaceae bacterium]
MVPDFKLLRRDTYRSGGSHSHYNPRTLFTRIMGGDFAPEGDGFMPAVFRYNATHIHERVHWLQHHGTSFGMFLEALRFSQQLTTLRTFRSIGSDRIRDLLNDTPLGRSAVMKLDSVEQYPIFGRTQDSSDLDLLRQIWFDHQWVHALFEDSVSCDGFGRPPASAVGEIFGDVMLALCDDARFECEKASLICTDPREPRGWFACEPDPLAAVDGKRLTSKLLMESAAVISEVRLAESAEWNKLSGGEAAAKLRDSVDALLQGDYGVPVRGLLAILRAQEKDLSHVLATASVLCFIALNPPVPPFVMEPAPSGDPWRWEDLYPPIRYERLCHVVREVGLIRDARSHKVLEHYMSTICEAADMPSALACPQPVFVPRSDVPDFDDVGVGFSSACTATYHDYLFWVQRKLGEVRKNGLPFFVSLGDCMTGELAASFARELLVVDENQIPYSRCPLLWLDSGLVGFSCRRDFGEWLIRSVALHYSLFDVIAGDGEYDLSAFPPDVARSEFQEVLHRSILAITA